jgi:ribonucleoside-diphosphate reductase alpha chain
LLDKIQNGGGSIQHMEEMPDDLKRAFVVAGDITPEWHLKIQAAFQKYVDNAISKTINFNNEATVQDVRDAYWMAYETGCKGITIYRDGSRDKQVLEVKKEGSYYDQLAGKKLAANGAEAGDKALVGVPVEMRQRPEVLTGRTYKTVTPVGTAFISINEDELGNIAEVFVNLGHAGSDIMADAEAMGRLISLAFRLPSAYPSDRIAQNVVEQLSGIGGSSSAGFGPKRVRSVADAVAKVIREHEAAKAGMALGAPGGELEAGLVTSVGAAAEATLDAGAPTITLGSEGTVPAAAAGAATGLLARPVASAAPKGAADMCPDCGNASLRFIEGCQKCEICGFSKC